MYYKLKSSFLEDTLSDIFDADGFDLSLDSSQVEASESSSMSQPDLLSQSLGGQLSSSSITSFISDICDDKICSYDEQQSHSGVETPFSNLTELNANALTNIRNIDKNHIITEFEAEQTEKINKNSWGRDLSRKIKSTPVLTKSASQEPRINMTEKLFRQASFTKRNPRKSLSRSVSQSNSPGLLQTSQSTLTAQLPDLETILTEKAKKEQEKETINPIVALLKSSQSNTLRSVDEGWLNRCNETNTFLPGIADTPLAESDQSRASTVPPMRKYGISNINVNALNSLEPEQVVATLPHRLDPSTSSFGMSGLVLNPQSSYSQNMYGEDDVIDNSDEESSLARIQSVRHVLKRRKVQEEQHNKNVKPILPSESPANLPSVVSIVTEKLGPNHHATKSHAMEPKPVKVPKKSKVKKKKIVTSLAAKESMSTRRSNRASNKHILYTDQRSDDSDVDPFAAESESDPDYTVITNERVIEPQNITTINYEISGTGTPDKAPKAKTVGKAKSSNVGTKGKRLSHVPKKKLEENSDNEVPEPYVIEYGTEIAKNIPRINITELKENSEMFDSFVQSTGPISNTVNSTTTSVATPSAQIKQPFTKREMELEKLEKKIASGKLNENFVRINIQKKVFVRGRKVNNYSKYKKSAWKHKKAVAALAGPEMDMRGCDGGFLVCFQCGQQGHFAQNCKIQSKLSINTLL